jgi:hypothetical protein
MKDLREDQIEQLSRRIQAIAERWKGINGGIYTIRAMSLDMAHTLMEESALAHSIPESGEAGLIEKLLQQARKVRNFSAPDEVYEAVPVRFIKSLDEALATPAPARGVEDAANPSVAAIARPPETSFHRS